MAFLPPEQENQYAPQGSTTSNPGGSGTPPPQVGGSAGAGTSGQAKPAATSAGGTPTQFGSSASKLGDYLSANAPQIQGQADKISGNLNSQYGQIQNDISGAINQFGQQVQGGYTAGNKGLVDQATSNPFAFAYNPTPTPATPPAPSGAIGNKLSGVKQVGGSAFNPNDYTANTQNINNFQKQYNDQYIGPQNFESTTPYSNVQNEVQSAVQNAGLLNSQAGLQNYLAGQSGPNATKASNTLDALLLNGNPGAQAQIQNAAKQFNGLTDQFGKATTGANQGVTTAQQEAQQAQDYARGQFGNKANTFNTDLQNKLSTAQGQNDTYNTNVNNLRNQLQSGDLSGATGVDQGLKDYLTNTLNPWFSQNAPGYTPSYNFLDSLSSNTNPQAPSLANVASSNDYSTLAALNQLGGSPITSPLSLETANQGGSYTTPTIAPVNNQAIAQDIYNTATAPSTNNIQTGAGPYHQYLADLAGLQNYLGNTNFASQPGNPWGPGWTSTSNPYNVPIPTIA